MDIQDIKELEDKSAIDSVSGVIEKQYPPADQTENDLKFSQHRQSFLINDGTEKLMVTLMKSQLHILDPKEGHTIHLTAGTNESGESRGLVLNRWQKQGDKYPSITLKVFPEATIRVIAPSGGKQSQPTTNNMSQEKPDPSDPLPPTEQTEFFKHLQLASYGYCLCLDQAEKVVADRKHLKDNPENIRAIATNFWMEVKHHLRTLAPDLNASSKKVVNRGASPAKNESPENPNSTDEMDDSTVIAKVLYGCKLNEDAAGDVTKFPPSHKKALDKLIKIADDRSLWANAYDTLEKSTIETLDGIEPRFYQKAFSTTFQKVFKKKRLPEKFICLNQNAWLQDLHIEIRNAANEEGNE